MKAFQIVDASNVLVKVASTNYTATTKSEAGSKIMWLENFDTSRLETGSDVDLYGLLAITGNRTYQTEDGSNSVLVLKVVDVAKQVDLFTRKDEKRTWTSKSGKFTTDAIFTRFESGRATLVGLDGKVMRVRLDELSDADRKFVSAQIKVQAMKP